MVRYRAISGLLLLLLVTSLMACSILPWKRDRSPYTKAEVAKLSDKDIYIIDGEKYIKVPTGTDEQGNIQFQYVLVDRYLAGEVEPLSLEAQRVTREETQGVERATQEGEIGAAQEPAVQEPEVQEPLPVTTRIVKHPYLKRKIAILPFEEKFFQKAGIACTYVGHPLLDELRPSYDKAHERQRFGLDPENMVIGLLPGSRVKEVQDMLPTLMKTVQQIQDRYPMLQVLLAQAHSLSDSVIHEFLGHSGQQVKVVKGQTNEVIAASDILLVTSGTATLQAALIGTPMVVLYRTSPLTYQIAKCLVKIPYISLVNLLAGKEIVPELIQNRMTPDCIAEEALEILRDTGRRDAMKQAFQSIRTSLGGPGASKRAAEIILAEAIS